MEQNKSVDKKSNMTTENKEQEEIEKEVEKSYSFFQTVDIGYYLAWPIRSGGMIIGFMPWDRLAGFLHIREDESENGENK